MAKQCNAKSKRTGERCGAWAMTGSDKCYHHGGKSLSGIAHPNFKDGSRVRHKNLPPRLAEKYLQAREDPDLLALRDEVALLDARLSELLGRVDSGESAKRWTDVQKAFTALQRARASGNAQKFAEAMFDLGEVVQQGGTDYQAWAEITSLLDQRRKLVESERKRLVEMQQMVSAEQAMTLMAIITDTIRRHVSDRTALAAIATDLRKLTVIDAGR